MKKLGRFIVSWLSPGLALIALGFFFGSQKNMVYALVGFLSAFVMGMTLICEGVRRYNTSEEDRP